MTLHDLANEHIRLLDLIEANDGELTPDFEAVFDAVCKDFNAKHDAYRSLMEEFERRRDARKASAGRLMVLAQLDDNAYERLKRRLHESMQLAGLQRVDTERYVTWIQKNGKASVEYAGDITALPKEYQRTKVELNKDKIIDDAKAGLTLPEGVLVTVGTHLRLK